MKSYLLIIMLLPLFLYGQTEDENITLLKKIIDANYNVDTYSAEVNVRVKVEPPIFNTPENVSMSMHYKKPDKLKIETGAGAKSILYVDGNSKLIYMPDQNKYQKIEAALNIDTELKKIHPLADIDFETIRSIEKMEDTTVEFNGQPVPVHVLSIVAPVSDASFPMPLDDSSSLSTIVYASKENLHIIKKETETQVYASNGPEKIDIKIFAEMDYLTLALNEDIPDSVFVFNIPEGAEEFSQNPGMSAGKKDLIGMEAPGFELTTLSGEPVKLSDYRGKVVLLDFWATWCAPCRETLPVTQKISNELKDKGLVVFAVNLKEDNAKVEKYIKENNYTFTTLMDYDGAVAIDYEVQAIPSFVIIDKEGKITQFDVGYSGEENLREALRKAGV